jgi:hypothetical protein
MSAPPAWSENPPASSAAPAPSPPPRRSRTWVIPTAIVAVIVVVLVAALFATGTLRFGSSSGNASYETLLQANGVASSASGSVAGGPWYVIFGAGIATPTAVLEAATNLTSALASVNCTVSWPNGEPANLNVPSTPESAGAGTAAYWTIGLKNASNAFLIEVVSDGSASALVELAGHTCEALFAYLSTFPPATLDSPAIAAAADAVGGSAFLAAHANATRLYAAVGGFSLGAILTTTPEAEVVYSSCTYPSYSGEVGVEFNATVAALSGAVSNHSTNSTDCGVSVPATLVAPIHGLETALSARKAI